MNCVNHPERPVAAYCQQCGKALCQECVRSVGGVVYCESCLAARLGTTAAPGPGQAAGSAAGPMYVGVPASGTANPGLALWLGFIPGVGAMYNGQFVKGLAHVFLFAVLCSLSDHASFFGILIPFCIFYQVFDAYQTAKARRDGTPLPNPFGLNDLGYRLGLQQHPEGTVVPPPPPGVPPVPPPYAPPVGEWTSYTPPPPPPGNYAAGFVAGYPPSPDPNAAPYTPPYAPAAFAGRRDLPTGAIVLIVLGVLFLLSSFDILRGDWLGRGWPLAIVGIGVYLLVRRSRENKTIPPTTPGPFPGDRNSL